MTRKLRYGTAYYPELWPLDRIDSDLEHMRRLKLNFVRMGEFAWSTIEPQPDCVDFSLFATVIDRLGAAGIDTVFCTPGATPPAWITSGHPERCFVGRDGRRMTPGTRQHICPSDPYYRERLLKITARLAEAFGKNPHLIGWQIDNEFKSGVHECCCDVCRGRWYAYLKRRYGSVETLNRLWHTAVWSMTYGSFDDVPVPSHTPFCDAQSPSLEAAYYDFSCTETEELQQLQIDVIRRFSDAPVTHNDNMHHHVKHAALARGLDFASFDCYANCDCFDQWVFHCDLWRSVKPGVPFCVMETSSGQNGCCVGYNHMHRAGYLAAEAKAAFALGAEGFSYWLFRQQPAGLEMPHGALLNAWGTPSVGYKEAAEIGAFLEENASLFADSRVEPAPLALLASDNSRFRLMAERLEHWDGRTYYEEISALAKLIRAEGYHLDLIGDGSALDGRKVLWTPFAPHLDRELVDKAKAFVEAGGVWIVGPASGYRTEEMTANTDAALTRELEEFAGVRTVFQYSPQNCGFTGEAYGVEAELTDWSSFFELAGATGVGRVKKGRGEGLFFLTSMPRGAGRMVMLGSMVTGAPGHDILRRMLDLVCAPQRIRPEKVTPGTLVVPRVASDGRRFLVAVNLDGKGGTLTSAAGRPLPLAAYECKIIR